MELLVHTRPVFVGDLMRLWRTTKDENKFTWRHRGAGQSVGTRIVVDDCLGGRHSLCDDTDPRKRLTRAGKGTPFVATWKRKDV